MINDAYDDYWFWLYWLAMILPMMSDDCYDCDDDCDIY